jgi:hypothetical protein
MKEGGKPVSPHMLCIPPPLQNNFLQVKVGFYSENEVF